jgi:dTDP-4-dehydrorhamnose 3,5-epimerase
MYILSGFAHRFCTLQDDYEVVYLMNSPYARPAEGAISWNDPDLAICWPQISLTP